MLCRGFLISEKSIGAFAVKVNKIKYQRKRSEYCVFVKGRGNNNMGVFQDRDFPVLFFLRPQFKICGRKVIMREVFNLAGRFGRESQNIDFYKNL